MKYAVVSSSQLRGQAMYSLCQSFLDKDCGHLLIGSYDMDYVLYEDLDILVFDYKYYVDYRNKIRNLKTLDKLLILITFDLEKKDLGRLPDFINLIGADSAVRDLKRLFIIEEKVEETLLLEDRDRSILFLLAQGLSNKEIGKKLYLSEKTIKNNLSRIYKSLEVKNRYEAIEAYKNKKIIYQKKGS